MVRDELAITFTGDSEEAQTALAAVAAGLENVEDSADDASDEVNDIGDEAITSAAQLGALSRAADEADENVRLLNGGLRTSLGTIVALGGAAATAAGAIGALGAGAAGVLGAGAFALGAEEAEENAEQLQQVTEQIRELESQTGDLSDAQQRQLDQLEEQRDRLEEVQSATAALANSPAVERVGRQFRESLVDVGEDFVGLVEDGLAGLDETIEATGEALDATDVSQLREFLRAAGGKAADVTPGLISDTASAIDDLAGATLALGRSETAGATGGAFGQIGEALQDINENSSAARSLFTFLDRRLPDIIRLGGRLGGALIRVQGAFANLPAAAEAGLGGAADVVREIVEGDFIAAFQEFETTVDRIFQELFAVDGSATAFLQRRINDIIGAIETRIENIAPGVSDVSLPRLNVASSGAPATGGGRFSGEGGSPRGSSPGPSPAASAGVTAGGLTPAEQRQVALAGASNGALSQQQILEIRFNDSGGEFEQAAASAARAEIVRTEDLRRERLARRR